MNTIQHPDALREAFLVVTPDGPAPVRLDDRDELRVEPVRPAETEPALTVAWRGEG